MMPTRRLLLAAPALLLAGAAPERTPLAAVPISRMETPWWRARHEAKLEEIQQQIDSGDLVVRKMTAAERKKFPPKPPREKKKR